MKFSTKFVLGASIASGLLAVAALSFTILKVQENANERTMRVQQEYYNELVKVQIQHQQVLADLQEFTTAEFARLECENEQILASNAELDHQLKSLEVLNNHKAVYAVSASFYTASADETDSRPWETATGTKPKVGRTIAVSRDLYKLLKGKKIYVQGIGIFTVEDTMNPRFSNKIDILVESKQIARELGVKKKLNILVLS